MREENFVILSIKEFKIFNLKIGNEEYKIYGETLEEIKEFIYDNCDLKDNIKLSYKYSTSTKENADEIAINYKEILKRIDKMKDNKNFLRNETAEEKKERQERENKIIMEKTKKAFQEINDKGK